MPTLPPTKDSAAHAAEQERLPKPVPPVKPEALFQEGGTRPSRPLPYALEVDCAVATNGVMLTFRNTGTIGAVFQVYDKKRLASIPRRYTVEAGKKLTATWKAKIHREAYDLWVLGPNGFLREFAGANAGKVELEGSCDRASGVVELAIRTGAPATLHFSTAPYMALHSREVVVQAPGHAIAVDTKQTGGWYDILLEGPGGFRRRLAGHIENGQPSTSDPGAAT
jgi:phospholipase C